MGNAALRLESGDSKPKAIRGHESEGYQRIDPFGVSIGSQRIVIWSNG